MISAELQKHRVRILEIGRLHGAKNIRFFGSVARGEATDTSDLDLLVTMEPGRSYLDFIAFWLDVEELLGVKIDLVSDGGLSPYLRDRILAEARPL